MTAAEKSTRPPRTAQSRLESGIRNLIARPWGITSEQVSDEFGTHPSQKLVDALNKFACTHFTVSVDDAFALFRKHRDLRRNSKVGELQGGLSRSKVWTPCDIIAAYEELGGAGKQPVAKKQSRANTQSDTRTAKRRRIEQVGDDNENAKAREVQRRQQQDTQSNAGAASTPQDSHIEQELGEIRPVVRPSKELLQNLIDAGDQEKESEAGSLEDLEEDNLEDGERSLEYGRNEEPNLSLAFSQEDTPSYNVFAAKDDDLSFNGPEDVEDDLRLDSRSEDEEDSLRFDALSSSHEENNSLVSADDIGSIVTANALLHFSQSTYIPKSTGKPQEMQNQHVADITSLEMDATLAVRRFYDRSAQETLSADQSLEKCEEDYAVATTRLQDISASVNDTALIHSKIVDELSGYQQRLEQCASGRHLTCETYATLPDLLKVLLESTDSYITSQRREAEKLQMQKETVEAENGEFEETRAQAIKACTAIGKARDEAQQKSDSYRRQHAERLEKFREKILSEIL